MQLMELAVTSTSDEIVTSGSSLTRGPRESSLVASSGESRERVKVLVLIAIGAVCYFAAAWVRYYTLRAGALDLGVWDQTMFLISQGKAPYSTILNIHMLADHAAILIYAIAQLYRIYPTICWLLFIQSASLAGAAWPIWRLARIARIDPPMARGVIIAYLLFPIIATASLRDFYPELLAVPALLSILLCARERRFGWFIFWLLLGLSTKEVMAITFAATGLYLAAFARTRVYGIVCVSVSVCWFVVATRFIIPHYGQGRQPDSTRFFSYMGHSDLEIIRTMMFKPWVPLKAILDGPWVIYLATIFVPVMWGLSVKKLGPLLCAIPCILLSLLSTKDEFHSPLNHYSLAVTPFVFLAVIDSLATKRHSFVNQRFVLVWSILVVVAGIAIRAGQVDSKQIPGAASGDEKRQVMGMIDDDHGVLASHQMVPHLTHRQVIQFVYGLSEPTLSMPPDDRIDWVVLDFGEDSMRNAGRSAVDLLRKYESDPQFKQLYHNRSLYLFHRYRNGA